MNNPYVGPRTFEEKNRAFFFGRDKEAEDLLALVISNRLVLFYAQSGAGKSSLLNAQLIPRLRDEEGFFVLPPGRVNGELPPGMAEPPNTFSFNLLLTLDKGQRPPETLTNMTLSDYLQATQPTHEAAWRAATKFDQPFTRVLIIDQFEEIFNTNLHHWSQRKEFFQQLRQAMQVDPLLWVVLSMREDYLASVDPYASILPNSLRTRYYMPRLGYQATIVAVKEPAKKAGRPFAPGVAEKLVDNLRQIKVQTFGENRTALGEYIEPVQLQVVCYQLWENLQRRTV